jgi:hypothetical protein
MGAHVEERNCISITLVSLVFSMETGI